MTISTSYVSSWESLAAVNDGYIPANYADKTQPIYGNWNGTTEYGKYNWVEYSWPFAHKVSSLYVYWFSYGGGIGTPTDAYISYWQTRLILPSVADNLRYIFFCPYG